MADRGEARAVGSSSVSAGPIRERARRAGRATHGLDNLIHQRIRLGIVSALAVEDELTFTDLKRLLDLTDGNLSVHARKLEEAGYLACAKAFDGRTPVTRYRLTTEGRRALEQYLSHMEALIDAARPADSSD